jgi:hypothetical protein
MVEPTPITIQLLQDIRDEMHATRGEMRAGREAMERKFEQVDARFEVVESVLRDLSQQVVLMARGVKVAIKNRRKTDRQLEDHERRIARLEGKDH